MRLQRGFELVRLAAKFVLDPYLVRGWVLLLEAGHERREVGRLFVYPTEPRGAQRVLGCAPWVIVLLADRADVCVDGAPSLGLDRRIGIGVSRREHRVELLVLTHLVNESILQCVDSFGLVDDDTIKAP